MFQDYCLELSASVATDRGGAFLNLVPADGAQCCKGSLGLREDMA